MARIPRKLLVLPNYSVHKIWRGHNREWNLKTSEQKLTYLRFLNEDLESEKYDAGAFIHALTLMSNHTHEVFGIAKVPLFSNHMRRHHSKYGAYFNRANNRCGKVAQDRPKTCLLGDAHHEMITTFYIHANPIRAKIVGDARNYFFSTHRLYAFGKKEPWMKNVVLPSWYIKLGRSASQRQKRYRQLFEKYLKDYGGKKQNFLKRTFFGPVTWTISLENAVKRWYNSHAPP